MSRKNINYVGQLFKCDGKPKLWEEFKNEFDLQGRLHFIYNQVITLERCTYGKLREYQKPGFPGPSLNEKSSNLFSEQIE